MCFRVGNRTMWGEEVLISAIKYKVVLIKHIKFKYETTTVWLLSHGECRQFLVIMFYLHRYQCWDAFVLIRFIFHFWLKTNNNAIRMAWCAFSKKSWLLGWSSIADLRVNHTVKISSSFLLNNESHQRELRHWKTAPISNVIWI